MLSLLLLLIPAAGAVLAYLGKQKNAGIIALGTSVLQLAATLFAWVQLRANPENWTLSYSGNWIPSLGIHFNVAIDNLSMLMIFLTSLLVPFVIWSGLNKDTKNSHTLNALILTMQMALTGVFMAKDGFLFYVMWELALIPIYFICLLWGGKDAARITFKFFVYTLFGSLFMLVGLIYLYQYTGAVTVDGLKSFDINALYAAAQTLPLKDQTIIFWCMFLAFAIKMPIFPLHTWQPDTYVTAPTQGTMMLSGIMLKMGTFGLIRWLLPLTPLASASNAPIAILLCVIGIIYASMIAIVQKDYKRLIAYSSIAHVGLIAAGILSNTQAGIQGAMIQMLAHGISVVALFLICDILLVNAGSRDITKLGGIRNKDTWFAVLFLIVVLGAVALPMTNGFVGEFMLLNGVFAYGAITAGFAGLTVILGAVYMLRSYQKIMLGEVSSDIQNFKEVSGNDKNILIVLCALILLFGVYTKPLMDITEPAVKEILTYTTK